VIINAQTGQWGTTYDAKRDIARVRAKRRSLKDAVERLTIELVSTGKQKSELRLSWEKTLVVLPIQIQEKRSK
jgi:DNA-binding TFAR19-related protein (PDSD5 family)